MENYSTIKTTHGVETLQKVRHLEKTARKLGKFSSHLHFGLQCKHNGVIPKYIRIKPPINDEATKKIVHRAERAILNLRITEVIKKKKNLQQIEERLKADLRTTLNKETFESLVSTNKERFKKEKHKSMISQRNKYHLLKFGRRYDEITAEEKFEETQNNNIRRNIRRAEAINKDNWVVNVSNRRLTESEERLLQKGAGFAIAQKEIPYDDYITSTEIACSYLPSGQALALKAEVAEILREAKPSKDNMTKREQIALKTLKKDPEIIITPADKGKALVVMDRKEYIAKMEEKLGDTSTYIKIDKDPTMEIKKELSSQLHELHT